jgi:hypothetical protein
MEQYGARSRTSPIAFQRKANGRLVPSINGRQLNNLEVVAECLFDNLGRVVPYSQLLPAIGRSSNDSASRHIAKLPGLLSRSG